MSDGRLAGQSREWTAEPSAGPPSASPSVPAPDSARRPSSLEAGGAAAGADSRWQRVEALFHGLMTIEPGQRDQQLAAWCGEDVALRQELLALLAADAAVQELMACAPEAESSELRMRRPEAGEALLPVAAGCDLSGEEVAARPAAGASPGLVAGMAAERVAEALVGLPEAMRPPIDVGSDLRVGSTIGPFVLEALLGRGGMGVVYRARRTSGGLAQIVAIKVIAWHLRSSPAVSQFLLEREALAQLEHAHVTRLIDGGIWQGTPYLVMEYVEGQRLDEFCDGVRDGTEARAAIPLREKLRLILQLCEALSYVHRNLILHRDLKPGNVMVTSDGSVKLLDFGTLKLMAATAADSDMTRAGMRPVTLRYASPEHIRGETVSTASEVYSLGMILYRVIAGRLPEGLGELLAGPELRLDEEDGASSLERYLGWLKQRPLPPPALAARATDPAERRLAHDLEAIVSKAVRYEPESRYATVDALAADLRRALGNRPVAARAGTLRYRLGRFYHRHTYPVLGTAAVVLVLATGLALVAGQSAIARGEQRRAEMGVEDERRLAHLLLFDYFEQLKQVPASTGAQRQAVTEALRYLDSLTHIPLGSPLELDKVQAYTEMGVLLGDPYEENLGDAAGATRTLQKILPEALKMSAAAPGDRVLLQAAAAVQTALGQVANGSGHARQALTYLEPAAAASRRIAASPGVTVPMLVQSAYVLNSFGDVYGQQSDYSLHQTETAMRIFGESLAVNQKALALDQHCSRCRSGVALAYWKLGMMAREEDENRAAEYYRDGLATLAVFSPAEQATTRIRRMDTFIRHRLGEIYLSNGHPQDGVRLLEMTRERFRLAVAADMLDARPRWDLGPLDLTLGDGYVQLKQYQKAVEAYREYVEMMNFLVHRVPESSTYQEARAEALLKYGELESRLGHKAAGEASSNEGLALVLSMAQKPAAETNELDLAVNALVDRDHRRDAPLALVLAQREIAASESVSVDQLLTLARAQRFAGLVAQSQDTVRKALRLLAVHPHSMDNTAEREQARKLLAG